MGGNEILHLGRYLMSHPQTCRVVAVWVGSVWSKQTRGVGRHGFGDDSRLEQWGAVGHFCADSTDLSLKASATARSISNLQIGLTDSEGQCTASVM